MDTIAAIKEIQLKATCMRANVVGSTSLDFAVKASTFLRARTICGVHQGLLNMVAALTSSPSNRPSVN